MDLVQTLFSLEILRALQKWISELSCIVYLFAGRQDFHPAYRCPLDPCQVKIPDSRAHRSTS